MHYVQRKLLLTIWMMPSFAAPRLRASSPSGCTSLAMAAGEIKNGAELSKPRMLVLKSTWETFLRILGLIMILLVSSLFFVCVIRSVAAEE